MQSCGTASDARKASSSSSSASVRGSSRARGTVMGAFGRIARSEPRMIARRAWQRNLGPCGRGRRARHGTLAAATRRSPSPMPPQKIKTSAFLANLPLFKELAPAEIDRIAAGTTELHVPRGEILFNKGDPCSGFHLVIYGQVKLSFVTPMGGEKVIEILGARRFVRRSADVHGQAVHRDGAGAGRLARSPRVEAGGVRRAGTRSRVRAQDAGRHVPAAARAHRRRRGVFAAIGHPARDRLPAAAGRGEADTLEARTR